MKYRVTVDVISLLYPDGQTVRHYKDDEVLIAASRVQPQVEAGELVPVEDEPPKRKATHSKPDHAKPDTEIPEK